MFWFQLEGIHQGGIYWLRYQVFPFMESFAILEMLLQVRKLSNHKLLFFLMKSEARNGIYETIQGDMILYTKIPLFIKSGIIFPAVLIIPLF